MTVEELWQQALKSGKKYPTIIIDGGSGAGKTSLGQQLLAVAPIRAVLVSMDDFYPGWEGLAAASQMVLEDILKSENPGYWRWDWNRSATDRWVSLPRDVALIIEGCGALTQESKHYADLAIWLEMSAKERHSRAIKRDGDSYESYWDQWAKQERHHWERHNPSALADVVIVTF
ncbi:MAG: cobalt ABC transporter [Propionibacteriaceae bacterium]